MRLGEPVDERLPWVRTIENLQEARSLSLAGQRAVAIHAEGDRLREDLRNQGPVQAIRTIPLATLLYPLSFAFNRALWRPSPFVMMTHRSLLVQVRSDGETRNILFNPTDYKASRATPYFARLIDRFGEGLTNRLGREFGQVDTQLAQFGLSAADIDLIAFDHFHTQDLRPLLGCETPSASIAARFPNAMLLAPRKEWDDWDNLHPLQRPWFVAEGKLGLPQERVILTDADLSLGPGAALLRTPGHTTGNQTLFVHGERGIFGCSENATSADGWAPKASRLRGLRRFADTFDAEVILNSNTPELCAEQYTSMLLEKSMVDPSEKNPDFPQMLPSSEVTPSWLCPGLRPSMIFGERDSGEVLASGSRQSAQRNTTASAAAPAV